MCNVEKKLDALIEALGFDIERTLDRKEHEIPESEGHAHMRSEQFGNSPAFQWTLVLGRGMALKRGKNNSYFRALKSPEVTFTLKKRV